MRNYKYTALQLDGKKIKGKMQAKDKAELHKLLQNKDLFLTDASEIGENVKQVKFKPQELSEFCRELGTMLSAGIPLIRAVSIMTARDISKKKKDVYTNLFRSIKQGLMLSEAMEQQGQVFPELLISMYRASEASGQIDTTSKRMAEHYEKTHRLRKKVSSAMMYPIILSIITLGVLLVVFLAVLPKFFTLFEELNTPLPAITRFMLGFSNFLKTNWALVFIGVLVFILALNLLGKAPKVRYFKDKAKLRIPVIGKLLKIIYTARFATTLSSTYASGISIVRALGNTRDTVGNTYIASQFGELIQNVRSGEIFSQSIAKIDGFDPKLAATILIGEETGKLDDMLNATANDFDYEAEMALNKLTAIVEPCMIVIMAVVVGTVIVSVMLPMTTLYDAIGAGL